MSLMRFLTPRAGLTAHTACPFCAGLGADSGALCNVCRTASLRGGVA